MKLDVLVIDDSLTVRMDLHEAFLAAGFTSTPCADLAAARRSLEARTPQLIVLDLNLPDGDGLEFLRELRARPDTEAVPVMLLTTEADVRDRVRGMRTGADEYVGKPYETGWVVSRGRELVRDRRGEAQARERPLILLVDDSLTFRHELRCTLEEAGYEVEAAASGEQGLLLAGGDHPDAVVVDSVLPGIDGPTVVRRIKADITLRRTPCLLLTGASVDDRAAELAALEAGADAYLRKGDDWQVVLARLGALLRGAPVQPAEAAGASLVGPKRVLAVAADATYRHAVAACLREEGYDVVMAATGLEALDLLRVQRVDGILLDRQTSGMPADEACRRIKTDPGWRDIPVIALADGDDPATVVHAVNAGADDVVVKSGDFDVLRARLRAQLRRRQVEDEVRRAGLEAAESRAARDLAETRAALIADLERKNAELAAAREQADHARRMAQEESLFKSRFLAGMSHELRTPLNAVIGFSELLEQELFGPLNPRQAEYVRNVLSSGRHLLTLVGDILDLSKVEAGRMTLVREWTALGTLVEAVLDTVRPLVQKKSQSLVLDLAPDLPEMFVDPVRIRQVLFNLLSNAIKFTPDRGAIRLAARVVEGRVVLSCTDTGIGIRKEDLPRLFREFERIESSGPERPEGTGLGLALTRRLVEMHGGDVSVESAEGRGSTFTVRLPLPGSPAGAPDGGGGGGGGGPDGPRGGD